MQEVTITVHNETGLHARPAALAVSMASRFKCALVVQKGDQTADLRSLIGLLSLGICHRDEITIRAEGKDEAEAVRQLAKLLADPKME